MPNQRSTDTVRRNLAKGFESGTFDISKVRLHSDSAFRTDVEEWMSENTQVSPQTVRGAYWYDLFREWQTKAEEVQEATGEAGQSASAPVQTSFEEAIHREMEDEGPGHVDAAEVDEVQEELDDLPYSTPVPGPQGRPWLGKKAWHGIAGEILEYVSPDVEADPAGILATMLSSFSCLIGFDAYAHGPIKQHVNVWHILMGDTGEGRKGTAADRAMEVMRRVEMGFMKKNTTSSLSSGEGLVIAVRDGMDEDEIARREENGHKVDYGVDDKRLLVMSTEFAMVMQKTHGGTLGPILRDLWDGKSLNIQSSDAEVATDPHVTVMGHVTPQEFADRQRPSEMAGGTWNRFMPIFVHMPHEIPWPEDPEDWDEKLTEFADRLREAAHSAGSGTKSVKFSKEAQLYYRKHVYPEYSRSSGDSVVMKQFTQRRLPHLVRVAGTYALMNGRTEVSLGDLEAAKAVVDYAIESARFVLATHAPGGGMAAAASAEDKEARDKAILMQALQDAGESGLNRTHISQKVLKYRRKTDEVKAFINDLELVVVKQNSGGRPIEMVFHPDFAPKDGE
ncbi:hypothetical protein [Streptomyces narbonensis]|uniref:hypothetical protein n=1 Tax=Streptomyces narbonensis TaxID=67333 RepID=UPI00340559D9